MPLALGMGPAAQFLTQTLSPKRLSGYSPSRRGAKSFEQFAGKLGFSAQKSGMAWGAAGIHFRTGSVLRECRAEGQTSIADRPYPRQEPWLPKTDLRIPPRLIGKENERPSRRYAVLADTLPPMNAISPSSILLRPKIFCPWEPNFQEFFSIRVWSLRDPPLAMIQCDQRKSAVPKTATRKPPVPNTRSFSQALEAFLKVDPRRLPEKGKLTTKPSPRKKKRRS